MTIAILADYRKEFSVNADGVVIASMRGVARICDVQTSSISKKFNCGFKESKLAQMLEEKGFNCAELSKNGHTWRVFWHRNLSNNVSTLIPVVYVEGKWFLHTRSVIKVFNITKGLGVDLTINLEEFEWMFTGLLIELNGNFCTVERIKPYLQNCHQFDNWSNTLKVFAEPKKVAKIKPSPVELEITNIESNIKPKVSSDELFMFHSVAMRLINEVNKTSVMKATVETLKTTVLEVAFDILKYAHSSK